MQNRTDKKLAALLALLVCLAALSTAAAEPNDAAGLAEAWKEAYQETKEWSFWEQRGEPYTAASFMISQTEALRLAIEAVLLLEDGTVSMFENYSPAFSFYDGSWVVLIAPIGENSSLDSYMLEVNPHNGTIRSISVGTDWSEYIPSIDFAWEEGEIHG